jgi:hypothetical protein
MYITYSRTDFTIQRPIALCKGKGKFHPITGHEGPEGE